MNRTYVEQGNPGSEYPEPEISDTDARHVWWLGHTYLGMVGIRIHDQIWTPEKQAYVGGGIVGAPHWLTALARVQRTTRAKGRPRQALLRVATVVRDSTALQTQLEVVWRLGGVLAARRWVEQKARDKHLLSEAAFIDQFQRKAGV